MRNRNLANASPEEVPMLESFDSFLKELLSGTSLSSPTDAPIKRFNLIPDRILVSGNATIVFWADSTKTVVRCAEGTEPNTYNAYTAALAIRLYGSNSHLKKLIERKVFFQKPKKAKTADVQEGGVVE